MIDEALSTVGVELEALVEVFLFEDDAVVDAGHIARAHRFAGADRVVIRLFAARERGEQVVADGADIEFVQMAAVRRGNERQQPVAGQTDLGAGVEVVIVGRELDPGFVAFGQAAMGGRVEQVVGSDQVLEDGVAQVRQVRAAEGAVPVAAVALAAVELSPGLVDERLCTGCGLWTSCRCRSFVHQVCRCRQSARANGG